ncbi:MAG: glycosyltransferase family 2 protein [Gammaproteobacteria bacterium]|nr:MAG: glycosyltransferase family 2 protein [Gammaproteobacteria bacterium]RTZ59872.1 MAG: glycosyltransferase family 2 protein [Gammaproteobacteria bacterium]
MASPVKKITVVIPNWNGLDHLGKCLDALRAQTFGDFAVIVVDNGSEDDSVAFIRKNYPEVDIIETGSNQGFGAACNAGITASNSPSIALLNNDTVADPDWLGELAAAMDNAPESVTMLASKMVQMQDNAVIDDAGDILTWRGGTFKRGHGQPASDFDRQIEVFSPCAGAALYRKDALISAGLFDESFFLYLEDIDLGLRMRLNGGSCRYIPSAIVQHIGHGSSFPHDRYVFFIARNRPTLFMKNFPMSVLARHIHSLIYGWFFYYLAYNRPGPYIRGTLAAIKNLPSSIKKRQTAQPRLSKKEMHSLLSNDWPEISLLQLIRNRLKAFSL